MNTHHLHHESFHTTPAMRVIQLAIFLLLTATAVAQAQAIDLRANAGGTFFEGLSGATVSDGGATMTARAFDGSVSTLRYKSLTPQISAALASEQSANVTLGEITISSNSTLSLGQAPGVGGARLAINVSFTTPAGLGSGTFTGVMTGRISGRDMLAEIQWMSPQTLTFTIGGTRVTLIVETTTFISRTGGSGDLLIPVRARISLLQSNTPPLVTPAAAVTQLGGRQFVRIATVSDQETATDRITVTASSLISGLTIGSVINDNGNVLADITAPCTGPAAVAQAIQVIAADAGGAATAAFIPLSFTPDQPPTLGAYANVTAPAGGMVTAAPDAAPLDNGEVILQVSAPGYAGEIIVNQRTGAISFFNAGPPGVYQVSVSATDHCGAAVTRVFTLQALTSAGYCSAPSFSPMRNAVTGSNPGSLMSADLNQDGLTDVVTAGATGTNEILVYAGNGEGTIRLAGRYPLAAAVESIDARDFNGDGLVDFIVRHADRDFSILTGRDGGGLSAATRYEGLDTEYIGDFNRDGLPDTARISVEPEIRAANITTTLSVGPGTYSGHIVTRLAASDGRAPQAGRFGDFNGDGRPDFAAVTDRSLVQEGALVTRRFDVTIYYGEANGQFTRGQEINPGTWDLNAITVTNLNDDGRADLILIDPRGAGNRRLLFIASPRGELILAGAMEGEVPAGARVGDFNGDGRADLAAIAQTANGYALAVAPGTETGAFGSPVSQAVTGAGTLVRGDFNRDRRDDLAVASAAASEITTFLNSCAAVNAANTNPLIALATPEIVRGPGLPAFPAEIAMVRDAETPAGHLQVTAITPNDLYVTGISNDNGRVTAMVTAGCQLAPGIYNVTLRVTDAGGLSALVTLPVRVEQKDLSANLSFFSTGLIYSRATRSFSGTLRITNVGPTPLTGPFRLELANLTTGTLLQNAMGDHCGAPFLSLAGAQQLDPGQTISVYLRFRNTSGALINYTPRLYADVDGFSLFPASSIAGEPEPQNRVSPGRFYNSTERNVQ
ncbi:MAG: FG-GAP repeat domain-containing protein [Blastocatellia bacterium]